MLHRHERYATIPASLNTHPKPMNNSDLPTDLAALLNELDKLAQAAADKANVDKSATLTPVMRSYYFGAMFGYEDTRDKIAEILAKHLKASIS